jgi:hypothetical protein
MRIPFLSAIAIVVAAMASAAPVPVLDVRGLIENPIHVGIGRWWRRMEAQCAGRILTKDAIEHQRMAMDVQVERRTEALHDDDGPAAPIGNALGLPRAPPQKAQHAA